MDADTLILIGLTFAAFCWWSTIQLHERRLLVRENKQREVDRRQRAERIRQLTNKM